MLLFQCRPIFGGVTMISENNNSRSEHVPALDDAQFEFHICCRRRENCRRNNQNSELCSQIKGLATRRPEKGLEINRKDDQVEHEVLIPQSQGHDECVGVERLKNEDS
ncbi:hypothetical protein Tco_0957011 [Tanacetum coccineum]